MASLARSGEDDTIAFCLANGAYFIETNMESANAFGGHPNPHRIWQSSAAAAEYSRQVAQEYYSCGRPYGYVFGGSGGYKTIACIENTNVAGGGITIGMCYGMDDMEDVLRSIRPGDILILDNSDYIAVQSYYRHQVPPDASFHAWDQFRKEDGTPAIPQREDIMGPGFCGIGTVQEG